MDIDTLRKICVSFKGVTEDVKWGNDLCFSVLGKMFCVAGLEHPPKIAFKVPDEDFEELSQRPGFMPAPYMARAKWVLVTDVAKVSQKEWKRYISASYDLVKAKLTAKARREAGLD